MKKWFVQSGKITLAAEFDSEQDAQLEADYYNKSYTSDTPWEPVFDIPPWTQVESGVLTGEAPDES